VKSISEVILLIELKLYLPQNSPLVSLFKKRTNKVEVSKKTNTKDLEESVSVQQTVIAVFISTFRLPCLAKIV